jgi:excinuclease ABC subunit C
VFLRGVKDPIKLRPNSTELFLLARIRDEAHRFANTYHRQLRGKRTLRSSLEDVPGVGDKRKKLLLRHLGSLKKIKEATVEELAAVPGMSKKAALAVHRFLFQEAAPTNEVADLTAPAAVVEEEEGDVAPNATPLAAGPEAEAAAGVATSVDTRADEVIPQLDDEMPEDA